MIWSGSFAADALWRAVTYVSVTQLHLHSNVLLADPLMPADVKERPAGHWGTVPGTAWALIHTMLADGRALRGLRLLPVLGAGHAGVVQLALAWLTGHLASVRPRFSQDLRGLERLCRAFPDLDGLGAEVHPALPAGDYVGGCLGGAFAFAQGMALDAPGRIVVPIVGDGECETPTTAASWLAQRCLPTPMVLPIIHVNGFRMGGQSLLGAMADDDIAAYAAGLGWQARIVRLSDPAGADHAVFQRVVDESVRATVAGVPVAVFLRCVKGWGGPAVLGGRQLIGTPALHKTPLGDAHHDPRQRDALERWLRSYRPHELFDPTGQPVGSLVDALKILRSAAPSAAPAPRRTIASPLCRPDTDFRNGTIAVLRRHAAQGDFRVFSPDELASNRLGELTREPWAVELLGEEVLFQWLAGWTATGRRGVLISYEAFAPLLTSALVAHLKHRRMRRTSTVWPSINLLLTSYGWQNVFTHGDPSLSTTLLASCDPAVRVLTPADPYRLTAALDDAVCSDGRVNIIIAGKHPTPHHPVETEAEERQRGLAIWPHLSDAGEPDLCLVAAGDLPAAVTSQAISLIRQRSGARLRMVNLCDLTVLGDPATWPAGLTEPEVTSYFGASCPILVVTLGHPAAVWGVLAGRLLRPVGVIGWTEPSGPLSQRKLAAELGLCVDGVSEAAGRLLARVAIAP